MNVNINNLRLILHKKHTYKINIQHLIECYFNYIKLSKNECVSFDTYYAWYYQYQIMSLKWSSKNNMNFLISPTAWISLKKYYKSI
jgi:hypothetical protein